LLLAAILLLFLIPDLRDFIGLGFEEAFAISFIHKYSRITV
jgi:hypothetical protein